jgi:hypothetical protein
MKMVERSTMSMWASVVTTHRAKALGGVIQKIDAVVPSACQNRQVGNIVGDLKARGRHDLIHELENAVAGYNEQVERDNNYIAGLKYVNAKLNNWATNGKRRAFLAEKRRYNEIEVTFQAYNEDAERTFNEICFNFADNQYSY